MGSLKPGWVQISASRPSVKVVCRLDAEPPKIVGGYGGWEMVDRPRRVAVTVWEGRQPRQMSLPIVLDEFKSRRSVVPLMRDLEKLALPFADPEPPRVRIDGPGITHTDIVWLVNNIEWGESSFDEIDRDRRTRQRAVLSLIAYSAPDRLATGGAAAAAARLAAQKTASKTAGYVYTVKQSDLRNGLSGIAARELGNSTRWKEIATLNEIRDPKRIRTGQKIRIPSK